MFREQALTCLSVCQFHPCRLAVYLYFFLNLISTGIDCARVHDKR